MTAPHTNVQKISEMASRHLSSLSVDCVVFGFHKNEMKVLLLKIPYKDEWALPGGFILRDESAENAASRILKERTGLDGVFLRQFHVFSDPGRVKPRDHRDNLTRMNIPENDIKWLCSRFVTIGFYALVDYTRAVPTPDEFTTRSEWRDLTDPGMLMMDHRVIVNTALDTLRLQLNNLPIGYNLLREKFTMPELQKLYETILGRKLDRRNFQRKILSYRILLRLDERKTGVAHKAPVLYRFDYDGYHRALEEGLKGGF
jgi:8-oxo-dGTP diphosphatase